MAKSNDNKECRTMFALEQELRRAEDTSSAMWAVSRLGQLLEDAYNNAGFEVLEQSDYVGPIQTAIRLLSDYAYTNHCEVLDGLNKELKSLREVQP